MRIVGISRVSPPEEAKLVAKVGEDGSVTLISGEMGKNLAREIVKDGLLASDGKRYKSGRGLLEAVLRRYNNGYFRADLEGDDDELPPIKVLNKASLEKQIEVLTEAPRKFIIAGYASPHIVDKQGHEITLEALREDLPRFMADPRYAPIMVLHSNVRVGTIIPEYREPETGKVYRTEVDNIGLFIVAELRTDPNRPEVSDKVIKDIEAGHLKSFSISGNAKEMPLYCEGGKCWRKVTKLELLEISLCLGINVPIWTSEGLKKIQDVMIGDQVWTHMARWRTVTRTFRRPYEGKLMKVVTGIGIIRCTPEHPVYRITNRGHLRGTRYEWTKAEEIREGDHISGYGEHAKCSYCGRPILRDDPTRRPDDRHFCNRDCQLKAPGNRKGKTIASGDPGALSKWVKVISVSEEDYAGEVYNLEVAEDNSFTTEACVVHNCEKGINQLAKFEVLVKAACADGCSLIKYYAPLEGPPSREQLMGLVDALGGQLELVLANPGGLPEGVVGPLEVVSMKLEEVRLGMKRDEEEPETIGEGFTTFDRAQGDRQELRRDIVHRLGQIQGTNEEALLQEAKRHADAGDWSQAQFYHQQAVRRGKITSGEEKGEPFWAKAQGATQEVLELLKARAEWSGYELYLKPGERPPAGEQVFTGKRGGRYYVPKVKPMEEFVPPPVAGEGAKRLEVPKVEAPETEKITEEDWDPKFHYGITRARAIALEGTEIPRGSAALFHFDKLTPVEQRVVIAYEKENLPRLMQEREELPKQARESARVDRRLGVQHRPLYRYHERLREADKAIERKKELIVDLERRAKVQKTEIEKTESIVERLKRMTPIEEVALRRQLLDEIKELRPGGSPGIPWMTTKLLYEYAQKLMGGKDANRSTG